MFVWRRVFVALLIPSVAVAQNSVFLYGSNGISSDVWAYSVNGSTGAITKTSGAPFPAQNIAHGIAVTPNNQFVYVANAGANTISAYVITPATGNLTAIAGSPFPTHSSPHAVAVDPTGRFAYAANMFSSDISAYTIDRSTGALTPVAGSPFASASGRLGFSIAIDATGSFLYAPNPDNGTVAAYSINTTTGALAPISGSPFSAGTGPAWVTLHPYGHFLYVTNTGSIYAFQVNASTGALSPVAGSPFSGSTNGRSIAIDPLGRFLYVNNEGPLTIGAFRINPSGSLTQTAGSPFAGAGDAAALIVDPSSQFLYAGNSGGSAVFAFQINQSTGDLVQIPGSPFASGAEPLCFAFATEAITDQLSIHYMQPAQGGNAGSVTVSVVGSGFQSGATVKLTGTGDDILASSADAANPSFLTATFNLNGSQTGSRDVIITNPDDTAVRLANAFTVQQGGAPQLWARLSGRDKIRVGVSQTFYINYGNLGATDALGTKLLIYFPTSVAPSLTLGNANGVVSRLAQGTTTVFAVQLGRVPAGSTSFIPITLNAGASQQPFQVRVHISGR